jgi:peptidoglycan/xylan/chitin deacetylase (PgdA/CDA1 family)
MEALAFPHARLPRNAVLLTFDDGYADHFLNVFPFLEERGLKACFFPPGQCVLEHRVLDVNKIQFVLASFPNTWILLDEVFDALGEFRSEYGLKSREAYLLSITEKHRYDSREVTIFKRLLQRELPEMVRTEIVRRLFAEHVTADEEAFACELYMSIDQIADLHRSGMHVGSHGYSHSWLNHISSECQAVEIDRSLDFLRRVGVGTENWTMCYPFGGFNDSLIEALRIRHCRAGFTVEPRVADLNVDGRLTLPRIDTNDLPS